MASNESNIDEYDFTMEIDIPPECLPVNPNEVSNTVSSLTESNSSSNSETDSSNDSDNEYDEISQDDDNREILPQYPSDNIQYDLNEKDEGKGCICKNHDSGSSVGPFLSFSSTIIDLTNPTPELFFNKLFDERMWTIIADVTNAYA